MLKCQALFMEGKENGLQGLESESEKNHVGLLNITFSKYNKTEPTVKNKKKKRKKAYNI